MDWVSTIIIVIFTVISITFIVLFSSIFFHSIQENPVIAYAIRSGDYFISLWNKVINYYDENVIEGATVRRNSTRVTPPVADVSLSSNIQYVTSNTDVSLSSNIQYVTSNTDVYRSNVYNTAKVTKPAVINKPNISSIPPYYQTVSYEILNGYTLNKPGILPLTNYDTVYNSPYYDANNHDVQYHSVYDSSSSEVKDSGIWVKNPLGELEYILWKNIPKYSTYYEPGTLKYGPSRYVPSYEDTVYLKKYTDKNNISYQK